MKAFLSLISVVLVVAAAVAPGDVAARTRGVDIVVTGPQFMITGVPGSTPETSLVKFEAKGKGGESFSLIMALRNLDGSFMLDQSGTPIVVVVPGVTIPADGLWSVSYNALAMSLAMPDYCIEAAAIPDDLYPGAKVLTWKATFRSESYPAGSVPPLYQTGTVEVSGVVGTFPTWKLTLPNGSGVAPASIGPPPFVQCDGVEGGPGGVYPIG